MKRWLTKLGKKFSADIAIAAHVLLALSCVLVMVASPLSWATVFNAAMFGWAIAAIFTLFIIKRSLKQNAMVRTILDDYRKALDQKLELEIENFAMRQYFRMNNIEFTVNRDGDNISATAEYKGPDNADATDDHEREDRTVH